ncbi:AAA family ATPase [Clostridium sp. CTA-1]
MIDLDSINPEEKLAIVCLYFSQIKSDDVRYAKKKCSNALKVVANRFGFTYSKAKNDRDAFDALYDNGRRGWTDRPLQKRSRFLFSIYEKYKDIPFDDLEKIANEIINKAMIEGRPYFSIKTKDPNTVKAILEKESNIEFDGLNILQDSLKLGQIVFIVLGGDKPQWDTGLIGMGIISKEPYDIGYRGKNYRIKVDIKLLLDKAIKREDLLSYRDTYGIIGIGPIVKWEPNQALSQIQEKNAIALMRAMLELSPSIENDLSSIIDAEMFARVKGVTTRYVEIEVGYGEKVKDSVATSLDTLFETDEDYKYKRENEDSYNLYTKEDFLKEVFISEKTYEELCSLLKYKKNLILQGAPGVGKTFAAKRLAYSILGCKDSRCIQLVQFHQSYSYEDFVMGYRPNGNGFELVEGPFYQFCEKARKSDREHFFIIDEINRGNMSKIFGELLMLIEADKRNESINMIYTNKSFSVPDNVYIIGMMNTADRSLAMLDYALRRRFSFYELSPAFQSDGFGKILDLFKSTKLAKLIEVVKSLNIEISTDDTLGPGFQIGHSYFCKKDKLDNKQLAMIVEYELIPLLKEYWFDELSKVEQWASQLRGALI